MHVVQTGEFETILSHVSTPDSKEINVVGSRIPIMGMYWISRTNLLLVSIDGNGMSVGYTFDVENRIL